MKKYILGAIAFYYLLAASANKSYNTFNWSDKSLVMFGVIVLLIVILGAMALDSEDKPNKDNSL